MATTEQIVIESEKIMTTLSGKYTQEEIYRIIIACRCQIGDIKIGD